MSSTLRPPSDDASRSDAVPVFIDLDSVLLLIRPGRRGPEVSVQPGVEDGLGRLRQIASEVVVIVDPAPAIGAAAPRDATRIAVFREGLGSLADDLTLVSCPHGVEACDCAKPGTALIEEAAARLRVSTRHGWHIVGDQEGVQQGRAAGLRTIRIGPVGEDHLSAVHRADHDARDLLDAANWIMLEALTAS